MQHYKNDVAAIGGGGYKSLYTPPCLRPCLAQASVSCIPISTSTAVLKLAKFCSTIDVGNHISVIYFVFCFLHYSCVLQCTHLRSNLNLTGVTLEMTSTPSPLACAFVPSIVLKQRLCTRSNVWILFSFIHSLQAAAENSRWGRTRLLYNMIPVFRLIPFRESGRQQ